MFEITKSMVEDSCWSTLINHNGKHLQYNILTKFYRVLKDDKVLGYYLIDDALFVLNTDEYGYD